MWNTIFNREKTHLKISKNQGHFPNKNRVGVTTTIFLVNFLKNKYISESNGLQQMEK